MCFDTHLLKVKVPGASRPTTTGSDACGSLFTTTKRVGPIGTGALLGGFGAALLTQVLHLGVELAGELLVLLSELADSVDRDPIVPGVLPALVVNAVLEALASLRGLDVQDLGLVQHFAVEAKDLLVLGERLGRLACRRHFDGSVCDILVDSQDG